MKIKETPKITVAIRKRPLNKKQIGKGQTDIIKIQGNQSIIVSEYKQKVDLTKYIEQTTFNFDFAFNQQTSNEQIYQQSIRPLIDNAFEGAKISCFAYGQTGSGKTFTMKGDMSKGVPGLYFLAAKQIFNYLEYPEFQKLNIFVSFYEIYCGRLFDLLNNRNQLKIREDKHANINIIGLEQKPIYSANQFLDIIQEGSTLRITSQNATNADSSRSHAIMQIHIKDGKKIFSKVSFIDLAGNQRGADHMDQNKQTKIDGAEINKSLLALKQCIRALDQGKGHTPFRGSKLTMVLKDSFVGFCKTVMIGNVSPNVSSSENTMNTLRYADRVKQLKKPSQSLTKEQLQAKQLMLPRAANKNTVKVTIDKQDDAEDIRSKLQMAKKKNNEAQKMDVQVSKQKQPVTLEKKISTKQVMTGKRTDSASNAYRIQDRKSPYNSRNQVSISKQQLRSNNNQNLNTGNNEAGSKKSASNNVPLYQKSNNLTQKNPPIKGHSANVPNPKINSSPLRNVSLQQLNRQHFDAVNILHSQFSKFKDNHSKLVKQQTIIIRDQMMRLGQMSQIDQYGKDADDYLDLVEKSIEDKIKLMHTLQNEVKNLRKKKNDAEQISSMLQEQKQVKENKYVKMSPMEIECPKIPQTITVPQLNNGIKYTYHSSNIQQHNPQPQQYMQHSNQNSHFEQQSHNNQYRAPYQPYYNNYSVINNPNTNSSSSVSMNQGSYYHGNNHITPGNNYPSNGYTFSQYHQSNNYTPSYIHQPHDEQLLEDLPGDQNMQRLF